MSETSESMTDVVTDNWRQLIRDGKIINNPCTYVKNEYQSTGGGIFDVTQNGKRYEARGDGSLSAFMAYLLGYPNSFWGEPPDIPDSVVEWSKAQALGNVDLSPYAFGEDLGELRETALFLKNPTKTLNRLSILFARAVEKLKKKRGKFDALDHAKAVAEVWTEHRFAMLPLLRSMHDAVESVFAEVSRPPRRTARGKGEWTDSKTTLYSPTYAYPFDSVGTTDVNVRSGILYEVSNPLNDWKYKYGLRFKNIPEVFWQLFPLSFMVDRVYNLSVALRGVNVFLDPNVKILTAWTTIKSTKTRTRSFLDYNYDVGVSAKTIVPDIDTHVEFRYDRSPWEPTIGDISPPLDVKYLVNSVTKIADLLSIILLRMR
jgi:hypothetical protein